MIASVIGKSFLKEYNNRNNTNYSAEEYFKEIFHPLFYDHEKYMQWITNSPFVQGIRKGQYPTKAERDEKLITLQKKVSSQTPDASIAIGFPSVDELATTSGQLTNIELPSDEEDTYASWIGGGLGIGLQGGYSIYFNHSKILYDIYQGWEHYRKFLQEYEHLRPNQVETWNGQWLAYLYSDDFDDLNPAGGMPEFMEADKDGVLGFTTQRWTEILIGISSQYDAQNLLGYVFSIGNTNKTVGFIPFKLPEIQMPLQFYIDLFGQNEFLDNAKKIKSLYGTAHSFIQACQKGVIGVPALEPKDLRQYMNEGTKSAKLPDYVRADEDTIISFNTYQTWLLAMLDNKELWKKANEAALAYHEFEKKALEKKKLTTKPGQMIEDVLKASSRRNFIEANIQILEASDDSTDSINALVEEVNTMPEDNFKYFLTLIKFKFSYHKSKNVIL